MREDITTRRLFIPDPKTGRMVKVRMLTDGRATPKPRKGRPKSNKGRMVRRAERRACAAYNAAMANKKETPI